MKTGFLIAILLTVILPGSTIRTLAAPGGLDPTFGSGGTVIDSTDKVTINKVVIQPDGKIVIVGTRKVTIQFSQKDYLFIRRYTPEGSLDTTYNFLKQGIGYDAEIQADGKLVVIGSAPNVVATHSGPVNTTSPVVWRFNANGTTDTTFGSNGARFFNTIQRGNFHIEVYNDQIFVAYGSQIPLTLIVNYRFSRLSSTGNIDYSVTLPFVFNDATRAFSMKVNPVSGNVVAAGIKNSTQNAVLRGYTTSGSVAGGFGFGGEAAISDCYVDGAFPTEFLPKDLVIQPDGKMLVHRFGEQYPVAYVSVVRHLADGPGEPGFCIPRALQPGVGSDLHLQPDGRFLFSWYYVSTGLRFFPDGSPATTVPYFLPFPTAIQPDQKFVHAFAFDDNIVLERRLLD